MYKLILYLINVSNCIFEPVAYDNIGNYLQNICKTVRQCATVIVVCCDLVFKQKKRIPGQFSNDL